MIINEDDVIIILKREPLWTNNCAFVSLYQTNTEMMLKHKCRGKKKYKVKVLHRDQRTFDRQFIIVILWIKIAWHARIWIFASHSYVVSLMLVFLLSNTSDDDDKMIAWWLQYLFQLSKYKPHYFVRCETPRQCVAMQSLLSANAHTFNNKIFRRRRHKNLHSLNTARERHKHALTFS